MRVFFRVRLGRRVYGSSCFIRSRIADVDLERASADRCFIFELENELMLLLVFFVFLVLLTIGSESKSTGTASTLSTTRRERVSSHR